MLSRSILFMAQQEGEYFVKCQKNVPIGLLSFYTSTLDFELGHFSSTVIVSNRILHAFLCNLGIIALGNGYFASCLYILVPNYAQKQIYP